jgi:acyl carrier protein
VLDVDSVQEDFSLQEGAWDSLALVATIAALDDHFGVTVDATELGQAQTVGELVALAEAAQGGA